MSAIVLDSSSDLPQSSDVSSCGSCLYKSTPTWTSSVLAPGANEELFDGRDIHVETHLRGLAEGETDEPRAVEASSGRSLFTFLVVALAVSYASRGLFYGQWGMVNWSEGPVIRTDVVVPAIVGAVAGTLATGPSR